MTEKPKIRFGFKRWLVVALIVVEIVLAKYYPPIRPVAELAPETITPTITLPVVGEVGFTNTILTVLIADVLLILAALGVFSAYHKKDRVPGGIAGVFEMLVEVFYNMVKNTAGKWAPTIFPIMASVFLLVVTVNLMKLLPGMESIGLMHKVEGEGHGYAAEQVGIFSILKKPAAGETGEYNVIPFFRPSSTDVNFTLALALCTMTAVQIIGLRAGGLGYFTKFINFKNFLKMWVREKIGAFDMLMPFIDIFVGILELISEFARIISFTFRLFGSMFAGAFLLGIMGSLFLIVQSGFLFLELFFGVIQAFVFCMLTLVFMTMATQMHGGHEEAHA